MSKKIFFFLSLISITLNLSAAKADFEDGFLFKPGFSIELQIPSIQANGLNGGFANKPAEKQLVSLENIALGLNLRLHRYFGLNVNWSQFTMNNSSINGFTLDPNKKAELGIKNTNFTSVFYLPLIGDTLDAFIELGASDVNYEFDYTENSGVKTSFKDHETAFLYGAGFEFAPYDSNMAFRLSAQKYLTKLSPVNGDILAFRFGLIKYF
jgi:opacity protein-like surface antigen